MQQTQGPAAASPGEATPLVRAATVTDVPAVADFLRRLSVGTVYRRFHTGIGSPTERLAQRLVAPRPGRLAWVATAADDVVALGNAAVDDDGRTELAVVVADAWQGAGLGTRLVEAALFAAVAAGAREVCFVVLAENRRVLRALHRAFPDASMAYDGGSCEVVARLRPPVPDQTAAPTATVPDQVAVPTATAVPAPTPHT